MTTIEVPMGTLSKADARALTDEVKEDAAALWTKLLRLYEGDAHKALGYKSWGQYYEAEFGGSAQEGKRMLAAGRVLESLEPPGFRGEGTHGSPLLTERGARELQPLLRSGARVVREAYEEAVEQANGSKPTAKQVREVVQRHKPPPPPPPPRAILEAVPDPMPEAPAEPERPAWVARLDMFAGGLQWWLSGGCQDAEENKNAARVALSRLDAVAADLHALADD